MLAMVVQLGNQTMETQAMLGTTDEFGRSLLMQAVACKNERAAQYLLELGADVDWGGTSYSNRTPLMQAACAGSAKLCALLLDCGADAWLQDRFGRVVSEQAAMLGRLDVVALLDARAKAAPRSPAGAAGEGLVEVDTDTQRLMWHSLIHEARHPPSPVLRPPSPVPRPSQHAPAPRGACGPPSATAARPSATAARPGATAAVSSAAAARGHGRRGGTEEAGRDEAGPGPGGGPGGARWRGAG